MVSKKLIRFILLLIFIANLSSPANCFSEWILEESFNAPEGIGGLTFDGEYLWAAGYDHDIIYKLDTSFNVISTFNAPGSASSGLAFDGTNLWCSDWADLRIYKIDPISGVVLSSFAAPGNDSIGLAFDGTYLWNSDMSSTGSIYMLDTSGNLIKSFASPDNQPQGLAFDGTNMLHANWGDGKIYKLDMLGNVVSSSESPITQVLDIAFDGTYLWAYSDNDRKVYKMKMKTYTVGGTVKGLSTTNTLSVQNNKEDDLQISHDGTFTFPKALINDASYSVTILSQPISPKQICNISNGNGVINEANVTNIEITCVDSQFPWSEFLPAMMGFGNR